jgi:hypothetical protein
MVSRTVLIVMAMLLLCTGLHFILKPLDPQEKLTGHENFSISLAAAQELTKNFRAQHPESKILGEYFGRDAIRKILDQNECVGLRIYYGSKTDGTQAMVMVGVDANNTDLSFGLLGENGFPCPPLCDTMRTINH